MYVPFCSVGQGHGEGSRGVHMFEKIVRSLLSFLRNRRMYSPYITCVYIVRLVPTCVNCLTWTTDAPKGLMDSGKAFVAYFEAVKKEYDVCLLCSWRSICCIYMLQIKVHFSLLIRASKIHEISHYKHTTILRTYLELT